MKKWRCTVCGYIHEGDTPPEECPVCGAEASKFEEIVEEEEKQAAEGMNAAAPVKTQDVRVPGSGSLLDKMIGLMLKNHVHPIAVHAPNGIIPAAVLFMVLAVVMNLVSLEQAAFYNMVVVLLAIPLVLFSGFIEWRKHYGGARTSLFFTKITCGITVLIAVTILVIWRLADPEVAVSGSSARWLYILLYLVALCAVGLAGHLGGKLVFGRKR
jgi:rubredoxin/uncharacterized membrane protein